MVNIQVKVEYDRLKVYINNLLHLYINTKGGLHVQAWVDNNLYMIEYISPAGRVKSEYEKKEIWEKILKQINSKLE